MYVVVVNGCMLFIYLFFFLVVCLSVLYTPMLASVLDVGFIYTCIIRKEGGGILINVQHCYLC